MRAPGFKTEGSRPSSRAVLSDRGSHGGAGRTAKVVRRIPVRMDRPMAADGQLGQASPDLLKLGLTESTPSVAEAVCWRPSVPSARTSTGRILSGARTRGSLPKPPRREKRRPLSPTLRAGSPRSAAFRLWDLYILGLLHE